MGTGDPYKNDDEWMLAAAVNMAAGGAQPDLDALSSNLADAFQNLDMDEHMTDTHSTAATANGTLATYRRGMGKRSNQTSFAGTRLDALLASFQRCLATTQRALASVQPSTAATAEGT